ncbi:hypothetical protein ACIP2Z_38990 [Streptomyces iakyrus]|uniref:Lipoprotein n=1 Tax=Streptomyces iakyrus TaxID=68219 RepID=A0ABW8FS56_9ACTN
MNRSIRLAALAVLGILLLTACGPKTYPPGPEGKVTKRSSAYYKSGGWRYWLTVGDTKFRVTRDDYRDCFHNSSYPACTQRTDRG